MSEGTVRGHAKCLSTSLMLALLWLGGPLEVRAVQTLDDVITAAADSGTFAGVVLVRYGDGSEYFRAVGDAVRELDVPHRRNTRYKLHSLTKPLTSVAIYSVVADGLIDHEASICTYLEPCPAEWQPVEVGHLLNHSSGLPELENDWYSGWQGDLESTYRALLEERTDFALMAEPGTTFRYSNGGYTLLARVLEVATGRPIESVMASRVFEPAGMTDAEMERGPDRSVTPWYNGPVVVDRLAAGYNGSPSEVRTAYSLMYTIPGAGGVVATADDLVRFARAVHREGLLPEPLTAKMLTPDPAVHERYADGWIVGEREGRTTYSHTGGTNGFLTSLEYYPELDLTIVIMSNLGFADLRGLSASIAEIALQSTTAPGRQHVAAPPCWVRGEPSDLELRASPYDSAAVSMGAGPLKVCYSRPRKLSRPIMGRLVPFGERWRLGASEATALYMPSSGTVAGVSVEPGWYSLYAIPGAREWRIVVNRVVQRWGVPLDEQVRDADVGIGVVAVGPATAQSVELMDISLRARAATEATISVAWERTRVSIPIVLTP